ncbi:MAG: efflux RND transporter periplasmic adaptor subunit [Bacteroidetes bacterium]|nr:efflux RND transporter periplasmic adaptor subunit [Bacteroidota bacterium]
MQQLKKRKYVFALSAALLIALLSSCGGGSDKTSDETNGSPVLVATPSLRNMNNYLQLNANTIFQKKEIVRATFQGFIVKFFKKIGDGVNAGDEILQIQTKESSADGKMDINLGKDSIKGKDSFKGIVTIRAKTSGVFTEQNHNIGDFVTDGEQIAVISDPSSIVIQLNVPYQFVSSVKLGSACAIDLPDGKSMSGIISKVLPSVDQASQTQTYLIRLSQSGNLPENLNVIVKIPVQSFSNALTVPKLALMTDETQSKFWVMKLINDSTAVKVIVGKGIENDSVVQLLDNNLTKDDRIVSEGAFGLPDTAKVLIRK